MALLDVVRRASRARWVSFMHYRRLIYCTAVINMGALLLGYDSGIAGAVIPLRAFKYDMGIDGTKVAVATVNSNVVSILLFVFLPRYVVIFH
ncbi:hypothetical protein FS749_003297 [Ceratobasidium sp. UAMH 11750]|nr:hypothetical protein FS749_003297 [Ceratobasidium sp. UAMH 11750]